MFWFQIRHVVKELRPKNPQLSHSQNWIVSKSYQKCRDIFISDWSFLQIHHRVQQMFNYFQYKLFEKNIYLKIFETLTLSSSFSSWNSKCVEIYVLLYCASPAIFIVWRLPNNFCFKYILRIEIIVRFWQIHCGSYVNEFHIKTKSVRNSVSK